MRNPKILVVEKEADLADQVRGVAGDLRPRPEVVPCDRLAIVNEVIASSGPFDVMIAGPSLGTRTSLARIQSLHDESPAMSLLLAFERRPEAALRDIVRTGALDLLQLPVSDRLLHDAIERAVAVARPRGSAVPAAAATTGPGRQGQVFTIASATGGCGKTFYSTNLAYFLHHHTGKRTCIVDLDLQFGEVSTALRLRPRYTISDALAREDVEDGDLEHHVHEYVVAHDSGVHVLPAPRDPSDADRIHPTDVSRVIEAVRARFDYVVVDTPAALTEIVLAAFDLSDVLFVMATMDLPSVRNMGVFLNTLDKLKIPSDNVRLVLNKAERDVGIDLDQITKLFPQGFSSVLPYSREVSKSVNVGTPILAFNPASEVSRKLVTGLVPLLPDGMQSKVAVAGELGPATRPGLFARLFRLNPQSTGS